MKNGQLQHNGQADQGRPPSRLEPSHRLKLYEQVIEYLRVRMDSGEWKTDQKLPSVRSLAEELGVHRLTVFKAYQVLKEEGSIYVRDKSGYYVGGKEPTAPSDLADDPAISVWRHWDSLPRIHSLQATYQFSQSLIDPTLLPNHYWNVLLRSLTEQYPRLLGSYSTLAGDAELREALAMQLTEKEHLYLTGDEILITSGAQQAIDLTARALVRPGDRVLLERPCYGPAMEIFRKQGAQLTFLDIHPYGYDLEELERILRVEKPRVFYLTPTFHNPTGFTVPTEQRKLLPELAEKYGCYLVEDDSTYDIYFKKHPPAPVFAYDTSGRALYIRSYSKYVAPGLRIAILICRPDLMPLLHAVKALADNGSPLLNQKLFLQYVQSPRMEQHLSKLRTALQMRKDVMEACLRESTWTWTSPHGGLNLWVELPPGVDTAHLLYQCMEASVSFVPGKVFDSSPYKHHGWIRLSYSYVNESQIRLGIGKLLEIAQRL